MLHHVGLIAGTACVAGAGGYARFYALGLVLSPPTLRRLQHRFGTWAAPAVAVVVFTAMFACCVPHRSCRNREFRRRWWARARLR